MRTFNDVLEIDEQDKTIRVEGGATWEDVRSYNTLWFSLKNGNRSQFFSIGGPFQ